MRDTNRWALGIVGNVSQNLDVLISEQNQMRGEGLDDLMLVHSLVGCSKTGLMVAQIPYSLHL